MTFQPPKHIQEILSTEGVLCLVGTGRSGKTALGHLLSTTSDKPKYVIDYPESSIINCPNDWHSI